MTWIALPNTDPDGVGTSVAFASNTVFKCVPLSEKPVEQFIVTINYPRLDASRLVEATICHLALRVTMWFTWDDSTTSLYMLLSLPWQNPALLSARGKAAVSLEDNVQWPITMRRLPLSLIKGLAVSCSVMQLYSPMAVETVGVRPHPCGGAGLNTILRTIDIWSS